MLFLILCFKNRCFSLFSQTHDSRRFTGKQNWHGPNGRGSADLPAERPSDFKHYNNLRYQKKKQKHSRLKDAWRQCVLLTFSSQKIYITQCLSVIQIHLKILKQIVGKAFSQAFKASTSDCLLSFCRQTSTSLKYIHHQCVSSCRQQFCKQHVWHPRLFNDHAFMTVSHSFIFVPGSANAGGRKGSHSLHCFWAAGIQSERWCQANLIRFDSVWFSSKMF